MTMEDETILTDALNLAWGELMDVMLRLAMCIISLDKELPPR